MRKIFQKLLMQSFLEKSVKIKKYFGVIFWDVFWGKIGGIEQAFGINHISTQDSLGEDLSPYLIVTFCPAFSELEC